MKGWKVAAASAALAGTAGLGAAVAPVASAQPKVVRAQAPRAIEMFTGGSRIGVSIREVEENDVKTAKLQAAAGAVVESVSEGSPADKAGIREGDVVVEFAGERVRGARHLTRLVQETPDGRSVQAVVMRDGQRTPLTVVPRASGVFGLDRLSEFAYKGPARPTPRVRVEPPSVRRFDDLLGRGSSRLGITVHALSPQLAEYFGTKDGVLVTTVTDGSPAAQAGLKAGDVITAVNGAAIDDAAELRRRIQDLDDGEEFTIAVTRDRKPQTLKGKLERSERARGVRTEV